MEFLTQFIDFFLHLDKHLFNIVEEYGTLTYVILFLIVFTETGLVIMPLLPGDSLLFAAGAIAANETQAHKDQEAREEQRMGVALFSWQR